MCLISGPGSSSSEEVDRGDAGKGTVLFCLESAPPPRYQVLKLW